jgi:tetratricopeptide (TPR) repeat protein
VFGDSLIGRALVATHEVGILGMAGRPDEIEPRVAEVEGIWAELGDAAERLTMSQLRGETEQRLGRLDRAEQLFRTGIAMLDDLGETGFNSTMQGCLANVLCDQGKFDEAEAVAERARELTSGDDFASITLWHQAMAKIRSSRGEHDAAIALADEAITYLEDTDYVDFQAHAQVTRGTVLANAGRTDAARAAFEQALTLYEAKGVVPSIARTRERLAELERSGS